MFKKDKPQETQETLRIPSALWKPGTPVNLENGLVQRIKEINGDTATFGPPENHPDLALVVGSLNRAAGTGGTWAFLELLRAILILSTVAPEMNIRSFVHILDQVMPGIMQIVTSRNNAKLPFAGELPFGIPVPQKTETTIVKRDDNGLVSSTEKFSL